MMKFIHIKKLLLTGFSAVAVMTLVNTTAYAISAAEKAREKIEEDRQYIYALEIPIRNFGSTEQKNDYNATKSQYMVGLGYYMQANFVNAYKELLEAQVKLDKLYEKVSMDYLERTTTILQELVKNMVEIDIEFNKESDLVRRYKTDRQAPKEKVYYDPKRFHLVYDKKVISRNVTMGFKRLGEAKNIREEAVTIKDKKYEEGQTVDPGIYRYRLASYLNVIDLCREAKKNAFQTYQLINRNEIYPIQTQFRGNRFAHESNLLPVFDPRIPDNYKVDASDALNLVHEDEIAIKLNLGEKKESKTPSKSTTPETQPQTQPAK
jgi:hypothetical protein